MTTLRGKIVLILLLFLITVLPGPKSSGFSGVSKISEETAPSEGRVSAVLDGDTVCLETGQRVRYLGMDAPEVAHGGETADCFGDDARRANAKMVLDKKVTLRYDGKTFDQYGRLLAYVYLEDGTFVNLEMVRSGNAHIYMAGEFSPVLPEFLKAQREALQERRGLWGACPVKASTVYFGNRRTSVFHRPECEMAGEIARHNRLIFVDRRSALMKGLSPCRLCKP